MSVALICLALNVYHEARGEPISDQVATAQAVIVRVRSPLYPNSICSVVRQRDGEHCQFTWVCESIPNYDARAWLTARLIASAVLAGSGHADFSATNYHARRVRPDWAHLTPIGGYGGEHIYYTGGG